MKESLKKLFFWSSLGGLTVGATVALARNVWRASKTKLAYEPIPGDCQRVRLWTERFQIEIGHRSYPVHDEYLLQPTPFKVWSLMYLAPLRDRTSHGGIPVYHVTVTRHFDVQRPEGTPEAISTKDEKFYGTVAVRNSEGKSQRSNFIARGGTLEMQKCLVGGASNGVPTGDIHRSEVPILHYRFEYTQPPK